MEPRLEEALAGILPALRKVFGQTLHSAIVTGSAVKGDFIPYYSDLDVHVYLLQPALIDEATPRHDLALAFREEIGGLASEQFGFAAFQIIFVSAGFRTDWAPPLPGTYRVLHGEPEPIFGPMSPERFMNHARRRLDQIPGEVATLVRRIVDKPDDALSRLVRLTGAFLKGQVYNAGAVITNEPIDVWRRSLTDILPVLHPVGSRNIAAFFAGIRSWPERRYLHYQRARLRDGIQAMADLAAWWQSQQTTG